MSIDWIATVFGFGYIAVPTGSAREKKLSHRDWNKKVAFHILPSAKSAPKGKVKGTESLTEAFKRHVKSHSSIVVDERKASKPALKTAGCKLAGTVHHAAGFRNPKKGHHTNDAESENARYKLWVRNKYSFVRSSIHLLSQARILLFL